jgi:hypothetical protein
MPQNIAIAATVQIDATGNPVVGGAVPTISRGKQADILLTDGTGSNQASKTYSASRTVASATNDDIDLAGALTDIMGVSSMTFATVKAVVIRSDPANTTILTVSPAPANGFLGPFGAATHTVQVRPGGALVFVAPQTGWTVTAATGDLLRIANASGAAATYTIEVVGT